MFNITNPPLHSLSGMLGTAASDQLLAEINGSFGGNAFFTQARGIFQEVANAFTKTFVQPIRAAALAVRDQQIAFTQPNIIRPIMTFDDLLGLPVVMQLPILTMPEVRHLLEQGRIDGFGYLPENLPSEDVYGRLIANGQIDDVGTMLAEQGTLTFTYEWWSDDPELDGIQLDAIATSREFVRRVLATTDIDPTDPRNVRY